MKTSCSLVHDTRRAKKSESKSAKYPVKLRVYNTTLVKAKLYKLGIDLSEIEFQKIIYPIEGQRLSNELKVVKTKLDAFEKRASDELNKLDAFTFDDFEHNFFRDSKASNSVEYYYQEKIEFLIKSGKIGTADSYRCSLRSISKYLESKKKKLEALRFAEINKKWLLGYEHFMVNQGKSKTTIGIYLRPLSSIFNNAIANKDVSEDYYPFGLKKYTIPKGGGVKKTLSKVQLSTLFHAEPVIKQQEKAKDFWFLSYSLNGMNIQDIAALKFKNLYEDRIEFVREKTKDTSQGVKLITTFLNDYSTSIIEKYRRKSSNPDDHVFSVLERGMTPEKVKSKVKIFTRFINQHIKILAKDNELPTGISTYWARHTFATMSVNKGASLEFMSEALGHSDLKTTQSYFAGFTNETKKDFAKELMNF